MCGIFGLFNFNNTKLTCDFINNQAKKSSHRNSHSFNFNVDKNIFLAFYRPPINHKTDQPIQYNNKVIICNGEIYNYRRFYEIMGTKPTTNVDYECIIHLYEKYGIDYTVNVLDGVFAFILIDYDIDKIFIVRDQFGERPLYYLSNNNNNNNNILGFSSEMKQLHIFTRDIPEFNYNGLNNLKINVFEPGNYIILNFNNNNWIITDKIKFANFHLTRINPSNEDMEETNILQNIHDIFFEAVYKRVITNDKPIACLLSGSLDSSIVAALVSTIYNKPISTYCIGLPDSEDLKYARMVAKHIGSNHTEVIVSEEDFFRFIPYVIENIESYDETTIRSGVSNLLISKYIAESSDIKVIFTGDGSDELMGGHLYINSAPDALEFDNECRRLLKNIHFFDILRSERCISSHGLEPRTPFLDRDFVTFYLSIPIQYRFSSNKQQEKYLFRKAFDKDYLPKEVLWRNKKTLCDETWAPKIDNLLSKQTNVKYDIDKTYLHNSPETMEQLYYRTLFEQFYPGQEHLIPYLWKPKYYDVTLNSTPPTNLYLLDTIDESIDEK